MYQSKSDDLIKFSKSPIAIAPACCFWNAECLEVLLMVFWMMFAIFLVACDKTSFIFYVMGCASPKYFEADWAAFAYELSDAWYYIKHTNISIEREEAYLFEEFLLHCNVVVSDTQYNQTIFRSLLLRLACRIHWAICHDEVWWLIACEFADQLILNQN